MYDCISLSIKCCFLFPKIGIYYYYIFWILFLAAAGENIQSDKVKIPQILHSGRTSLDEMT